VLPQAHEASQAGIAKIRQLEEKIARIESELGRVPEADAIAKYQTEMEIARKAHAVKMAEIEAIDVRIEALKRQRDEATRQLERFGEQDHAARIAEDDRQRMLKHSKRVRETLDRFRTKVIARHVANMEALMLESFQKLLRKADLVHGLKIDPETFEVSLRDKRGQLLPFDRLSAGERQLLATAMLWGLARASGRPIPTVIDTPLGRLDSAHRSHLVERYFPQASHQVLLLSTDEEIVNGYHIKLKPAVARHYLLDHDEKAGRTEMKPGYFEKS
jgi:DNA sulfur modification protein DndD